jgi:hypothetical protein
MSDQSDKTRLQTAAKALMDELRKRHLHNSFRIKLGKLEEEYTGGWAMTPSGHRQASLLQCMTRVLTQAWLGAPV